VESLDRAFENVCELDLVFHFDEVFLHLCRSRDYVSLSLISRCITYSQRLSKVDLSWRLMSRR
jgi:hypothetical protein